MAPLGNIPFLGAKGSPYKIPQSLRFNSGDSTYLNWTPGSAGDRTLWTWSAWIKRSGLSSTVGLFGSYTAANNTDYLEILFASGNNLLIQGNSTVFLKTSQLFRDASAWYHIVIAVDTSNATANDRIKLWVNGEQVTAFDTRNNPSSGGNLGVNQAGVHRLGRRPNGTDYFNGYMAEVNFIDGSALGPESFGKTNAHGVWTPVYYSGSYTGNSFYLKFASGDGTDSSGLSNTWTANNFSTSGTGTDVMSDTPTTNWATLNVLAKGLSGGGTGTTSNGNLQITYSATNWYGHKSTIAVSSGKWYYEVTNTTGTIYVYAGFSHVTATDENASNVYRYRSNGTKKGTSATSYGATWSSAGDICGVAFDADAGTIEFYKNGVSQGTAFSSIPAGEYAAEVLVENGTTAVVNFGQRDFEYTPPTGFKALNTSNLPAPEIKDGSNYFNTVIYTGASPSDKSVTGVGFQPDFTWIKARTQAYNHALYDAVRGATKELHSNTTDAEDTDSNGLKSFDSDGFTVGSDGEVGDPTGTRVSWNWLAGNGTSSNTHGSITSTVSASPSSGFSVVSYTGDGSSSATVGHGLGVVPSMIWAKSRDTSEAWMVKHKDLASNNVLEFANTNATADATGFSNGSLGNLTSSTTFGFVSGSIGVDSVNKNSDPVIAYCFAEVEGFSKIGSYTGNGSTDGIFIHTGFKVGWWMVKRTDSTEFWYIRDTTRDNTNPISDALNPNTADVEGSYGSFDFLSNGIKIRESGTGSNTSGGTYIFMALAENPFGGEGVSPATAR